MEVVLLKVGAGGRGSRGWGFFLFCLCFYLTLLVLFLFWGFGVWLDFFVLLFVLGHSVRCKQSMYSTTIFITFWWAVKMGGELLLYPCQDSTMITPSGKANTTLKGPSLLMDRQGLPRTAHRSKPPHCEIPHPGGGTKHSCLYIIWGLGHQNPTIGYSEDKKSWQPPLDLQRRTRPFYRIKSVLQTDHVPSLQQDCSHTSIRLLPPHWPTDWQVIFWAV